MLNGKVYIGALPDIPFSSDTSGGFRTPIMVIDGMEVGFSGYQMINYLADPDSPYYLEISHVTYLLEEFAEEAEKEEKFYNDLTATVEAGGAVIQEQKTVMIDGHPALLVLLKGENDFSRVVIYARDKGVLQCVIATAPKERTAL